MDANSLRQFITHVESHNLSLITYSNGCEFVTHVKSHNLSLTLVRQVITESVVRHMKVVMDVNPQQHSHVP